MDSRQQETEDNSDITHRQCSNLILEPAVNSLCETMKPVSEIVLQIYVYLVFTSDSFTFSHSHVIHTLLQDYDNAVRPETRKGNVTFIHT